jgi:hypothetical protein
VQEVKEGFERRNLPRHSGRGVLLFLELCHVSLKQRAPHGAPATRRWVLSFNKRQELAQIVAVGGDGIIRIALFLGEKSEKIIQC